MTSSHSMPGPELSPAALTEAGGEAAIHSFASHARHTGIVLLVVGGMGAMVGVLAANPLSVLLALVSGVAGGYLVAASQQLGPVPAAREGGAEPVIDSPREPLAARLRQGMALAGEAGAALRRVGATAVETISRLVRAALLLLACLTTGLGVGLIIVGIFALREPALWAYDVVSRTGPPLGPLSLSAGIALVVAQVLVFAIFYRRARLARSADAPSR
jgi:hypothetical protein